MFEVLIGAYHQLETGSFSSRKQFAIAKPLPSPTLDTLLFVADEERCQRAGVLLSNKIFTRRADG